MMKAILFATSLASSWALTPAAAKLIVAYATNFETMDDSKADAFFNESVAVEREKLAVRERNVPKVRAVLPAKKAARFFQIENKLDAIVNVSLAQQIPLVPLKK